MKKPKSNKEERRKEERRKEERCFLHHPVRVRPSKVGLADSASSPSSAAREVHVGDSRTNPSVSHRI